MHGEHGVIENLTQPSHLFMVYMLLAIKHEWSYEGIQADVLWYLELSKLNVYEVMRVLI